MYALMFAAVIRLRYTQPDTPRPYRIPGGLPGVWLIGGIGLLGCIVSFVLGFIPPSQLKTGDTVVYVLLLALATVVLSLPPFVFALLQRRRGAPGSGAAARVSPDPGVTLTGRPVPAAATPRRRTGPARPSRPP